MTNTAQNEAIAKACGKPDRDVAALKACCKAIDRCTSDRMRRATIAFLLDRYVTHPAQASTQGGKTE